MHGRTIVITCSGCSSAHSWQRRSASALSRAYEKSGAPRTGCSSVSGTSLPANAPYAVVELVTSICSTSAAAAASSTVLRPVHVDVVHGRLVVDRVHQERQVHDAVRPL